MRKFLQKRKRKGFTLVELLIVIIIIGILAGSMLLVMGAGKDKAEATKIVSNLRSLKAASIMYYADNNEFPSNDITVLNAYMDAALTGYTVEVASDEVWLGTSFDSTGNSIAAKLAKMEEEGVPIYESTGSGAAAYDGSEETVYMMVQ